MTSEITAPELVKKLGLNKNTFDSWVRRGRLDEAIISRRGSNGLKTHIFHFEKAAAAIQGFSNVDINIPSTQNKSSSNQEVNEEFSSALLGGSDNKKPSVSTINQAKLAKEFYGAQNAKLDYEERLKTMVKVRDVKAVFYNAARIVRNSLLSIPGRLAAEISALDDDKEIERILTEEIYQTLEGLQDVKITSS